MSLSGITEIEEPPGTVNNPPVGGPAVHESPHDMNQTRNVPSYGILPPVIPQEVDTTDAELEAPIFPGHHPGDRSAGGIDEDQAVDEDHASERRPSGHQPFDTKNLDAVPTFERASSDWTSGTAILGGSGVTFQVAGRQRGRKAITLSVPSSYPNVSAIVGVAIGNSESEIQGDAQQPYVLNEGDSISIYSEAPVWVGLISGQTTGIVQWKVEYNPVGGQLGNL